MAKSLKLLSKISKIAMKNNRLVKLLKLEQERPSEPFIQFAIAQELQREGELTKACERYQGLLEKHPNYTGTYYHLGKLYEQLGSVEQARSVYVKGIEISKAASAANDLREITHALNDLEDED
jgi:tetratricopeptide (TPR) repeat protein